MKKHDCVYITASSTAEAEKMAKTLVEERLVATVNILQGATSFYRWHGKVEKKQEVLMIALTTRPNIDNVISRVTELSSVELPCVVYCPIHGGNTEFLSWVYESTV